MQFIKPNVSTTVASAQVARMRFLHFWLAGSRTSVFALTAAA